MGKSVEATAPTNRLDNGLGLDEFLKGMPQGETPKDEAKAEKPDDAGKKADPPKADETKTEKTDEGTPAAKADGEVKADAPKVEPDPRDKRLKDKDRHISTLERENADLRKQFAEGIARVEKKLDGTYVEPQADPKAKERDDVERDWRTRVRASVEAMADTFDGGRDAIIAQVFADDAPFRAYDQDLLVQARIRQADNPVKEALTVLKEAAFHTKYGTDPDAIKAKLVEELTPVITDHVTKELTSQLKANGAPDLVRGLGGVRAAASRSEAEAKKGPPSSVSLDGLFPHLAQTRT
jgi:hypothetical protein